MIRFTGMLTGILITIGLYLLYLNINMQAAPVPAEIVPEQLVEAAQPSPDYAPEPMSQVSGQENEAKATPPMVMNQQPQPSPDTGELEAGTDSSAQEAVFWEPFHSRYSATGFARRMTIATGIQIHVLPADKHQYRVAFNYQDEDDRATKISTIEGITGLELTP